MGSTVLLTGATGFVGQALGRALEARGDRLLAFVRDADAAKGRLSFSAELVTEAELGGLGHVDAIIHLAGENVAQRWTASAKERIVQSRVKTIEKLLKAFCHKAKKPGLFLSASAIGFYGDRGDELVTEASPPGHDFLADVCVAWEAAAREFQACAERIVLLRFGLVLGPGGGALGRMLPAFRMGAGGRLGGGEQWMSWIHLDDLVALLVRAVDDQKINGIYNAVAPEPVRNAEFTEALAVALGRKAFLPVPAFGLKLALGEMAGMLLASQRVSAERLVRAGFTFRYPKVIEALRDSVSK